MCSNVRKGTNEGSDCLNDQCSRLGTITAWPSEETGKSSVAPCSKPMNSAWANDTELYSRSDGSTRCGRPCRQDTRRISQARKTGREARVRVCVDVSAAGHPGRSARTRGLLDGDATNQVR